MPTSVVPDRAAVAVADPDPDPEPEEAPAPAHGTQVSTGTQDAELEPLAEEPCELAPPEDDDPCSPDLLEPVAAALPGPPPAWQFDTAGAVNGGMSP
jgi:hypothetical protein